MIRKCMAEVGEHPQMAGSMRRGPDVVHRQLRDYTTQLVKQRGLQVTRDEIRIACMMLQGALFADAMGRDIMPDLYPPLRRAGAGYARLYLRMLGAEGDSAGQDERSDEKDGPERTNGGRAASGATRRGKGRQARPPRST